VNSGEVNPTGSINQCAQCFNRRMLISTDSPLRRPPNNLGPTQGKMRQIRAFLDNAASVEILRHAVQHSEGLSDRQHSPLPHLMTSVLSLADQIAQTGRALTADELGMFLTISRATIFRMAKAGRIPSFRIGTCVRFEPEGSG
jgi:excisionase family DNA binding protein